MDISIDYYAVLGVDSQASISAIKASFKRLALQYHPDVYKGADAQERMRSLLQAYQILGDPEARKEYDVLRGQEKGSVYVPPAEVAARRKKSSEERYAFPDLSEGPLTPLSLKLGRMVYHLSATQAEDLKLDGMLRGMTFEPWDNSGGTLCSCQRCEHRWSVAASVGRPLACPSCHARDWAEYLLLRCIHCHAVFASKELHDPLRENALYHPYELFPLCPHCRRSQWCPAENSRINSLRLAASRRAMLLWSSVIGVCVLLVALVAVLALR